MRMSKRYTGGVTVMAPSPSVKGKPRRRNTSAHCACESGMPITLAARATRSVTGAGLGMLGCWSSMGPTCNSGVPQISAMSWVMRSMCATVSSGSTPRSKRWPASVAKL